MGAAFDTIALKERAAHCVLTLPFIAGSNFNYIKTSSDCSRVFRNLVAACKDQ